MAEYRFRAERLRDALTATTTSVDQWDLDEAWENAVDDCSDLAYVITEKRLDDVAAALAAQPSGPDPQALQQQEVALNSLASHADCPALLDGLRADLLNVIDSLVSARRHLFNDLHMGSMGELQVEPEALLNQLRPRLGTGRGWLDEHEAAGVCPWCGTHPRSTHESDCEVWDRETELDEQRERAFAAHVMCEQMGTLLTSLTATILERVEDVAVAVGTATTETGYGRFCDPHQILPALSIEDLDVRYDPARPASIATALAMPPADQPYCHEDDLAHTEPHRACRMLIS